VFSANKSYAGAVSFLVPCGQCIGCRVSKVQDWKTRLYHEGTQHEVSSFVTLTFADEHLPPDYSVSVRDIQLFCKRLRKRSGSFRFFACGEYGEKEKRPHYHLILFGRDFSDKYHWRDSESGYPVYRSDTLEALWPFGNSDIGSVTPASCGYVAAYCVKKVTGEHAEEHYRRVHPLTGELLTVRREFICMSNRPGIGAGWFEKYGEDAFPSDFVVVDGTRTAVPRYYEKKLEDAKQLLKVKQKRKEATKTHAENNTPDRLAVREEVNNLRILRKQRELDTDT